MRKILCMLLSVLMALSLVACGAPTPETPQETPIAIPETAEANEENPLPKWLEKREDGYCYLLPDAIDGIQEETNPMTFVYYEDYMDDYYWSEEPVDPPGGYFVPFASLSEMQDVLLYSLPTYYYKWHLGHYLRPNYRLGFDPRNLMAPVLPSSLEYERVEVTASAGGYYVFWMTEDAVYWKDPLYHAFMRMECYTAEHIASLGYDDYYEDVFMQIGYECTGTEEIENGIIANVYSYGNGKTALSYSVSENYHVIEYDDCAEILIADAFIIRYAISTALTREELWSFGAKPFVPAEDITNRDLSDTLVRIHEGSTYSEIVEILGDPGEPGNEQGYMDSCTWTLPDGSRMRIRFGRQQVAYQIIY